MFKPFLAACTTLFVAGLAVVPSADAALHWSAQYQVDGPEPPPFDAGGFFPTGNGYSMYANSTSTNASGQYSIPALARFNTSGDLLWSVYMDAGQDSSDQELQAVFGNLDEFFAGYIDESNEVVKLSIYNTNLVAEYAVQFPVSAAEILNNSAQVSLDADDYATVLRNIGTTVKTLVLSETGAELVDKTFSSPLFSADTPGFVTQQAIFDRLSGIDGYLLSVFIQRSFFDFSDPFNPVFGTTNTVVAVQLDDAGDINWATNFSLVSDLPVTPVQTLDENGNVVYILNDGIAGLGGQTNFAHVVKLNASGGLDWAKTIDDVVLTPARIVSSGVWISGTSSLSTNGTSDAVLLRLDGASGSLLAQATFDVGGADFASYAGGTGSEIFFSLNGYGFDTNTFSATNATGYVASADITLQNFTFREYTPTNSAFSLLWHDPVNSCLIYSPIVAASTNALTNLTVIALDENLATDAGCDFFDDATVNVLTTGLSVSPLNITLEDPGVSGADGGTVLAGTTLPVATLSLLETLLCSGTPGCSPPFLSLRLDGTDLFLEFDSATGCLYHVRATTNLVDTAFGTVQTEPGTGGEISINLAPLLNQRYYEVEVTPSP